MIRKHLDKDNLHHAYLIEGEKESVLAELLSFFDGIGLKTAGNPDFCQLSMDGLQIEEAFNLRDLASQKSFSSERKIFIVIANSITRDAQGVLLKLFEEPAPSTHFFMIIPDAFSLLPTLRSRFYFISAEQGNALEKEAEWFVSVPRARRIDFLKEFLKDAEEDQALSDSARTRAGKFLNALEAVLHQNLSKSNAGVFDHLFKVREYLRQPGSSVKSMMESLALVIPVI